MQEPNPSAVHPAATASATGASELSIEATGLVRRFGEVKAVSGVSLSIQKGEFFSLLGPSGCGKTTLLRMIAGLDLPDEGTLKIGGVDACSLPAHRRPVNTVFQSYALFPHMTVAGNIAFGLRMKKVEPRQITERVTRIMSLVEVSELADRKPAQLSGGQKQRVALARAVVNEPDVLLLDEPLGALDLKLRRQLQGELHQLQRRLGITFVYVTHDQEEALVMSDRIAVMNAGRIEQLDNGEELYERPRTRFVAQFLGACNLLAGVVERVTGPVLAVKTSFGQLSVDARVATRKPVRGENVTLAIRPEKVRLMPVDVAVAANQVKGVIEDLVYSGAETQYRVRVGDHQLNVVALNSRPGHQGLHPGQDVLCQMDERALIPLEDPS